MSLIKRFRTIEKSLAAIVFLLLLAAFILYGLQFIERTSFLLEETRYYALFDDAMISMRYARNLANGDGLVWNAGGERVEGFSNPLWVLVMAGAHLLPGPINQVSRYVQFASLGILVLNVVFVKLLAQELSGSRWIALLAAGLTAFYYPLNNWSLQGMEVGLLALLVSAASYLALRAWRRDRFSPWPYVLMAVAVLTRMDAAVLALTLTGIMAWLDADRRRRHLSWGLGLVAAALASLTAFRLVYYGEWLPNTYYLKLGGISTPLRISLGIRYFLESLWNTNWVLMLLPLLLLAFDRRKEFWLLFGLFAAQAAYSIYTGGDSWEHVGGTNRFISTVMPLFWVLFVLTLQSLKDFVLDNFERRPSWAEAAAFGIMSLIAAISLLSLNILQVQDMWQRLIVEKRPPFVAGTQRYTIMGLTLKELTMEDAVIGMVTAGNIAYFSERPGLDLMGKTEAVVAGTDARITASLFRPGSFRPGHNKWDYAYSIGELQPDVVAQIWPGTNEEAAPYLEDYLKVTIEGIPYYFRLDSNEVLWDRIPPSE